MTREAKLFTPKPGQYLAFIYYYTKIHGRAPLKRIFSGSCASRRLSCYPSLVRSPGVTNVARGVALLDPDVCELVHPDSPMA